jgi:hypothetical protein
MRKTLWIVGSLTIGLGACSPGKVVHDQPYFASHASERASMITACHDNPGQSTAEVNCVNAIDAQADIDRKRSWTVKPPASRQSAPDKL